MKGSGRVEVRRGTEAIMDVKSHLGRRTLKWSIVEHDKNILCSQEISEVMHFKYSYYKKKVILKYSYLDVAIPQ